MLKPAILALIRQVLTVAGTALVAKGLVQASDVEPVIGALLTIGSAVGSVADKRGGVRVRDSTPIYSTRRRADSYCCVLQTNCGS